MQFENDEAAKRFVMRDNSGNTLGYMDYMLSRRGVLFARKTFVEPPFRGKGLAKPLVDYAVGFARQHGYKIRPVCKYVNYLFAAEPEKYSDVIYQDDAQAETEA